MHGSESIGTSLNSSIPDRIAYPVPEVAKLLGGVTPRYIQMLIASGRLKSFTLGRRRLVARVDIDALIAELQAEEARVRAAVSAS